MANTIFLLQKWGEEFLYEKGIESNKIDAKVLLTQALSLPAYKLITDKDREVTIEGEEIYNSYIKRRAKGEPIAYIIGKKEFYSNDFIVNPKVLVPRPETELLVDEALGYIRAIEKPLVVDLCTGSGCIAITLGLNSYAVIYGTDISKDALDIAKKNRDNLKAKEKVILLQGDLFSPLPLEIKGKIDVIVSNPPYIPTEAVGRLQGDVKDFEPRLALDGGKDGLTFYKRIIYEAPNWLKNSGKLMFEIGFDQGKDLKELLFQTGFVNIEIKQDYSGLDRLAIAEWRRD